MKVARQCQYCEETFYVVLSKVINGAGKFCSRGCSKNSQTKKDGRLLYKNNRVFLVETSIGRNLTTIEKQNVRFVDGNKKNFAPENIFIQERIVIQCSICKRVRTKYLSKKAKTSLCRSCFNFQRGKLRYIGYSLSESANVVCERFPFNPVEYQR